MNDETKDLGEETLVKRLRSLMEYGDWAYVNTTGDLLGEAADEINRLYRALTSIRIDADVVGDSDCADTYIELLRGIRLTADEALR